jgi:hypothetical protein
MTCQRIEDLLAAHVKLSHLAFILFATFSHVHLASAECVLPPAAGYLATPNARYAQALTYADHRCFKEAKALLGEATAGLAKPTGVRDATLRNLVASATDYVAALESIEQRDLNAGYAMLQRIIDRGTNVVSLRAVMTLGRAVVLDADDTRWKGVVEPLSELSRRGYPEAELLLIQRLARRTGIPAAIGVIEDRLREELDLQRSLALEVLLIELYTRANRLTDANLVLSAVAREAASTLLDVNMRKRLLEAGLAVSDALVRQGRVEFSEQRDAYARALLEMKRFVS